MKKSCILLMTLILCLCAGCSSQPAPDASQTRPETNLFETQVNSVNRAFVAETDLFRYVAALNQGLAEIDKESGEIVWYPERDSMFDLAVLNDGRIVYEVLDYQANTGKKMLEEKVREVFADMVVLKDPQRSEYFSNLSIPSYMRDWLVMKFSDDEGVIDYDSVRRYIKRYIPSREDFEQYKFQMVNGESVQFLARVRVSVDVKSGKTVFELPDFGGARGGASGVVAFDVVEEWQETLLRESENWGIVTLCWTMEGTASKPKGVISMVGYKPFCPYTVDLDFYREARQQFDTTAIKRICTAFLKLLFPHVQSPDDIDREDFIKYCLQPAMEMRGVIYKQLCIIDPKEYSVASKAIPEITCK